MKNLFTILLLVFGLGLSTAQTEKPVKVTTVKKTTTVTKGVKLKKDGTPDKRYKNAKVLKKDGTPDMRYKENKK